MARLRTRKGSTVTKVKSATRRSRSTSVDGVDLSAMKTLVSKISDDILMQEVLAKRIGENKTKLEDKMVKAKLRFCESSKGKGEIVTPDTRESNTIDARKFFKKASKKDFFDTISVPLGKAKKVLSEKELDKITTKGTTEQKDDFLKVTPK